MLDAARASAREEGRQLIENAQKEADKVIRKAGEDARREKDKMLEQAKHEIFVAGSGRGGWFDEQEVG